MHLKVFMSHYLSTELHVFSGPEVSDQPVNSHTSGPHNSLPRQRGSGKTHTSTDIYTMTQTRGLIVIQGNSLALQLICLITLLPTEFCKNVKCILEVA